MKYYDYLQMNTMKPTIVMMDLDGVMADFDSVVDKIHPGHTRDSMKMKDFWKPLSQIPNFFYTLPVLYDAYHLYWKIKNFHGMRVEILTALPIPTGHFVTAHDDKTAWVHKHIDPSVVVNTVVGGKNKVKWLQEHPGAILIDDYKRNIDLWNEAGGIGILHKTGDSDRSYREFLKHVQ